MGIISQIENNEVTSLLMTDIPKACLEKDKSISDFLQALEGNTSITTVDFKDDFLACIRAEMRSQVIQAVGKLPHIQEVYLGNSLTLVPDLTDLLTSARSLTTLSLKDICLQGPPECFDGFETALRTHPCLKVFDMKDCTTANQSIDMCKIENIAMNGNKSAALVQ